MNNTSPSPPASSGIILDKRVQVMAAAGLLLQAFVFTYAFATTTAKNEARIGRLEEIVGKLDGQEVRLIRLELKLDELKEQSISRRNYTTGDAPAVQRMP